MAVDTWAVTVNTACLSAFKIPPNSRSREGFRTVTLRVRRDLIRCLKQVSDSAQFGRGYCLVLECWTRDREVQGSIPCRSEGRIFFT